MNNTETYFYIDVPLHSVMRIRVQRPIGMSKKQVLSSITRDELALALPVTEWDCVKHSWEKFLQSKSNPIGFSKGKPPISLLEQAFGFSFYDHQVDIQEEMIALRNKKKQNHS